MNLFGVPDTLDGLNSVANLAARSVTPRAASALRADARRDWDDLAAAFPRRWGSGWQPPAALRPADILAMRSLAASGDVGFPGAPVPEPGEERLFRHHGMLAAAALDATPFWLPGRVGWGLARTDPPDLAEGLEIRLPAPTVTVWFESWLRFDDPDEGLSPGMVELWAEWQTPEGRFSLPTAAPWTVNSAMPFSAAGTPVLELALVGVTLFADDDGRPLDVAGWIVAAHTEGQRIGWSYMTRLGRPSDAFHRPLWASLCGVVAWGVWDTADLVEPPKNKARRRRLTAAGVDLSRLGPVRVLPARRAAEPDDGSTGVRLGSSHASPTTHLRRGHWHRVRHGPGRAETRMAWYPPTVVNPDGGGQMDQRTVFRLPTPK